jgi:hypothetical protein
MRSIVFWWLLRTMDRQWWANFIERYGQPFLKGRYKNKDDRRVLERAFRMAQKLGGIVVSQGAEAEIVQAANVSGEHYEKFIELCNREISKVIVGQTLTSNVQPTGLGNGTANLHGEVRGDLRRMDCQLLAQTLRAQLFTQFCLVNGLPGNPPTLLFGSLRAEEMATTFTTLESLRRAGYEPDDDGEQFIAERVGFGIRKRPEPGYAGFNALGLAAPSARRVPAPPDHIAAQRSAALAAAFTGQLAPLADAIRESTSPDDCLRRITDAARQIDPARSGDIIAQAFAAYAAAGHNSAMMEYPQYARHPRPCDLHVPPLPFQRGFRPCHHQNITYLYPFTSSP